MQLNTDTQIKQNTLANQANNFESIMQLNTEPSYYNYNLKNALPPNCPLWEHSFWKHNPAEAFSFQCV